MEKTNSATIVCNHPQYQGKADFYLNLYGENMMNVYPQVSLFHECFKNVNARLIDFIEIATFIYVADQCVVRCQNRVDPHGILWNRRMNMIIAVQDLDFWSRGDVKECLEKLLRFLSDDCYCFSFTKMTEDHPEQQYLVFDENLGASNKPERVMLFSGGLDSLGGAIQSLLVDGKRTVLVRHKASSKHKARYEEIEKELRRMSNDKAVFFSFDAKKDGNLSHEYTQRSRSILYFAFAAVIAKLLGLKEVLFFENGPISLNLPMSPQVVGGRATRTTHPKTLHLFEELFRKIADKPQFVVRNPFISKTKSDVVKLIIANGCEHLIPSSISCAHSWQQTNLVKHCGSCSQCIDRRVALIAAGAERPDDVNDYATDFFVQSVDTHPKSGQNDYFDAPNKNLLASYFLRAEDIGSMKNVEDFQEAFPEINYATPYMENSPADAALQIFDLYKRLAQDIQFVINYTLEHYGPRMADVKNPLPEDSLAYILTRKTQSKIVVTEEQPLSLPDYVFCDFGGAWILRFKGREKRFLVPLEGCRYIVKLLSHPNEPVDYSELILTNHIDENKAIDGDEMMATMTVGKTEAYDPVMDKKSLQQIYKRMKELKGILEDASSTAIEKKEAQDEYDNIEKIVRASLKKGGKARNLNLDQKRKQDSVRRAFNTVIKNIKSFEPEMAEHLKKSITF